MAISKAKKEEVLATLEMEIKKSTSVAFTSNTKLTVEEITNLRNDLRKVDAKFMLAKKTLIRIAFKNVFGVEISEDIMPWQVAILISSWDKIAGLSVVNKYAQTFRKDEKIKFVGAYMDWVVYDSVWATKLATIPSKEVLLAKLLGSMKAPISALARFFDGAKTELENKGKTTVGELIVINMEPKAEENKDIKIEEKEEVTIATEIAETSNNETVEKEEIKEDKVEENIETTEEVAEDSSSESTDSE